MPRVVVVGGGVAGLAVARELIERVREADPPVEVLCLEAADRPGGNIRSERSEGFLTEWGPNGFLDNVPATLTLVKALGIEDRLFPAAPTAQDRFLYRGGRLHKLPMGPVSFLRSGVLSLRGRLRLLLEPFRPGPRGDADESVHDFAARRIGPEAARILVGAMVTGIYAGDSTQLSLEATFPKMWRMEREHGTLTRAMMHKRREARRTKAKLGGPAGPGGRLTSFRDGLDEIIRALAVAVGPALRTRHALARIEARAAARERIPTGEGSPARERSLASPEGARYTLVLASGERIEADAVVLAAPAWETASASEGLDPALASLLRGIPSASLAVVHLGYYRADFPMPPDGFGFLVPRGEGPRILGCIWASSIFPGRAPEGKALLTTMIGGALDPEAAGMRGEELVQIVRGDLESTLGLRKPPCFVRIYRHPRGIPQYPLGHPARLRAIEERLAAHPGIFVCGNSYRGIAVNSCVDEAPRVATRALESIGVSAADGSHGTGG